MTSTSRVTLNPAFLQEIKEDHRTFYRLLAAARHHLGHLGGYWRDRTPRAMVDLLERVRDRLAMHLALEEAYGYFEDPVWTEPQISIPAQRLREEHRILYGDLHHLTERAAKVCCIARRRCPGFHRSALISSTSVGISKTTSSARTI